MKIPGVKTAKTLSRWVQARLLGGALIVGYHRVADVKHDEYEVCVAPEHFAQHMQALSKYAHPIHLAELVQCLKAGSLPPRAVAVTFDDGYADNLYEAKPVLEQYEIPATVFACSGYAGREFWWDELERLVMSSQGKLGALRLDAGMIQFAWEQPEASSEADGKIRRKFFRALHKFLLVMDVDAQNHAMEVIRGWSGASSNSNKTRSMTHQELLQITDGGLVELGSHTRNHPMLPRLALEKQQEEIAASKQDLEELLGRRVNGFAYPNGMATENTKQLVREAGFTFACTSLHDVVRPAHDLHALTRFWQKDVDGDHFLRGLRLWMKGGRS